MESFNDLVKRGYLSKLVTKATKLEMATSDLHIRGGDFIDKEMSLAFDRPGVTDKALDEVVKYGEDYKKWLIFAIDIEHAEHIAENLLQRGIPTGVIHSKMEMNRARILDLYRSDKLKCIVNVNVLTTGFDHPGIDLIALLRPTCSPVIHVQTVGRGLRVVDGKDHCLVLDFAGNTARLGPINDIHIKEKRKKGDGGEPITKTCPECDTICHPTLKICEVCGHKFKFKVGISVSSSGMDIVKEGGQKWFEVTHVSYALHEKQNAPTSVLVRYHCGLRMFKEWICIEHKGYAGHKARGWVKWRYPDAPELALTTAEELLSVSDNLNQPTEIKVDDSKRYPVIIDYKFNL
jgi:DNA repair protein RadD